MADVDEYLEHITKLNIVPSSMFVLVQMGQHCDASQYIMFQCMCVSIL